MKKTCKDFAYLGIDCCDNCHHQEDEMREVLVDAAPALLCCRLFYFFYPNGDPHEDYTPEEKLLRAIFKEDQPCDQR